MLWYRYNAPPEPRAELRVLGTLERDSKIIFSIDGQEYVYKKGDFVNKKTPGKDPLCIITCISRNEQCEMNFSRIVTYAMKCDPTIAERYREKFNPANTKKILEEGRKLAIQNGFR